MPPEWAPHAAVWTAWPAGEDHWEGHLERVRDDFAGFLRVLSSFERVELIVRSEEAENDARARLVGCDVGFHRRSHDDIWLRDCAPIFVTNGSEIAAVDWIFNGWGDKFKHDLDNQLPEFIADLAGVQRFVPNVVMEGGALEVNGAGVLLTTRQCLLEKHRNPDLSAADLERSLSDYLGVQKILWLEDGMENDHTDGHIDTISRFASERVIVTCICEDVTDPNYAILQRNLELLRGFTDLEGQPFEIVALPLPANRLEIHGRRLPPTYANFYIGNGCVIVPTYGDPNDARALEILRGVFPAHQVIGSSSRYLITGGGSFHCVTQQQPLLQ